MNTNQKTLQAYETHVQEYINGTPQSVDGVVKDWIDTSLTKLPKTARILEFGSAFGRDAAYMQSLGYKVECTDATQAFVELLKKKGFKARKLNALTDDLLGPYDLIFANAVLLHFTREEMKIVLKKIFKALRNGGKFAFTLKQGEGEEWSDNKLGAPRFFCYWTERQIRPLIEEVGFTDINISADQATTKAIWLQIIAKK